MLPSCACASSLLLVADEPEPVDPATLGAVATAGDLAVDAVVVVVLTGFSAPPLLVAATATA